MNKDGSGFAVLREFSGGNSDGSYPIGTLVEARDGVLYGTASHGGESDLGVVFKITRDGADYAMLHAFSRATTGPYGPAGRLIEGSDGRLYGTTLAGGTQDAGTVFAVSGRDSGSIVTILHSFAGADGRAPLEIVEASDGALYGASNAGGNQGMDQGVVFKIQKDGTGFTVLHNFGEVPEDAEGPCAGVVEGSDGTLYGTAYEGGTNDMGAVFRINKDGSSYAILRSFSDADGDCPYAGLVQGSDGKLYGATTEGGSQHGGTVFKINHDGAGYSVLCNFVLLRAGDGEGPRGDLTEGSDGALYGTTAFAGSYERGTVFKMNRDASGFTVLVNFSGTGDGDAPSAQLLEGSDGQLYGTTARDGVNSGGVVFRLKKDGTELTRLYHFTGYSPSIENPFAALIEGSDAALYGTAAFDGTNYSAGTVYRLTKDAGQFEVIHRFTGTDGDGAAPRGALIKGADGALYGTTFAGGVSNNGTVFKLNEDGSGYAVLRRFTSERLDDARRSAAALIQGSDGALYGTTELGGSDDAGTVFKLNPDGGRYAVLYSFNNANGAPQQPTGSLVEADDGALYGITIRGGAQNKGTAFRLGKDGSGFVVVHCFTENGGDGTLPVAGLTRTTGGAFYGVCSGGGDFSGGTVFKLFSSQPQITITGIQLGTAGALLKFSGGAAGQTYQIDGRASLDVRTAWQTLGSSLADIDGHFKFVDPASTNYPARFYRSAIR